MANLWIGDTPKGERFYLPEDLGDKKIALLAQSKKGKTYGLGVILEELAKAHRPFIASDPANNLWGLRVRPDGSPSGLPVVVIGGDHADIPFEKDQGERMAEALLATPICAVIDVAFESLGSVRRFWTDFAGRLMRSKPEIPRVIVLEEAPVLIPQKARGPQMELVKAAVSKLATIGGNFGYGVIPASQRAATIDKDVLSQCEGLIVMGMTHAADRKTVQEWMQAKDIGDQVFGAFEELGSLKPGEAWYWNPTDDVFQKFTFRKRETLHPREMQKLGLKASAVQLGDAQAFVDKVKRELKKRWVDVAPVPSGPSSPSVPTPRRDVIAANMRKIDDHIEKLDKDIASGAEQRKEIEELKATVGRQRMENESLRVKVVEADKRLAAVRKHFEPEFNVLKALFDVLGEPTTAADRSLFEPMLVKAGNRGCRRMLELMIERQELTKTQLGTLAGVPAGKSTFRAYISWMKSNGLIEVEGDRVKLKAV